MKAFECIQLYYLYTCGPSHKISENLLQHGKAYSLEEAEERELLTASALPKDWLFRKQLLATARLINDVKL